MKISFNWLKEYVQIDLSPAELAEKLIHTGFNLESIAELPDDTMLDLEVTSNRADCLGHLGVAREVAAILGNRIALPDVDLPADGSAVEELTDVEVQATDLCPRYTARVIRNVTIGPSPKWMVDRLQTIGLRSINNIVDITNYVLMETGQPLHAFDLDKLESRRIVVRRARAEEPFVAIDHSAHKLDAETLVIADTDRPVALAGIMGGLDTEVSNSTKNILLESADFEPVCIRHAARKFNLHSDSSYRFERRVDPLNVEWASQRAAALMIQLAGGKLARGVIDRWARTFEPTVIDLPLRRIKQVLGIEVDSAVVVRILTSLGFTIDRQDENQLRVVVPSYRAEVARPIDLVEEVGRIVGLDSIPMRDTISIQAVSQSRDEKTNRIVHQALNHCGFNEAITVTLVDPATAALFTDVPSEKVLRIAGDRRQANDALRCSLIPSLLMTRRLNQDVGNPRSDLYEIARTYKPDSAGGLPREKRSLAILSSDADFRTLRGAIELILQRANAPQALKLVAQPIDGFLPDQSAKLFLGEQFFGIIGTITPEIQKTFDLKKSASVAEIDYDLLTALPLEPVTFSQLPRFPAVERDLSIIVDEQVSWDQIQSVINTLELPELESIEFGELFRGKQVPKGKKSLFFTLRYRNPEQSLTHQQVDAYQQQVVAALETSCNAQLRTA